MRFDDLPTMSFGGEPGYEARRRVEVSGISIDERDAAVIAAGGRIVKHSITPRGVRAGRRPRPSVEESYYLIPNKLPSSLRAHARYCPGGRCKMAAHRARQAVAA